MNKKIYRLIGLFIVLFIVFFININNVQAGKVMCVDPNNNNSNTSCTTNGAVPASMDSNNDGEIEYYYVWWEEEPGADFEDEVLYRGVTYNGKSLKYYFVNNNGEFIDLTQYEGSRYDYAEIYKKAVENSATITYPDETTARERNEDTSIDQSRLDELNERSGYDPGSGILRRVDMQGIGGNSTDITIDCSGFSVLHTIYIIILIVSPILVIVLGTIDYAKSVMTSDMEKMKKFKKKLPVRIIALVLLITVPVIIDVIFTVFADNFNNNLMYCITKGTSDPIKLKSSGNSSGSSSSGSSSSTTDSEPELTSACSSACSAACSNRSYAVAISSCNTNCNNTCRNSYDKDCKSIPDTTARLNCYSTYATEKASNYDNNQDTTSVTDTTPGGSGGTSGSSGGSGSSGTDTRPTCSSCQRIQSSSDRSKCLENCRSDSSSSSSGSSSSSTSQCNNCNNIQDTTAKNNCKKLYCK